MTATPLPDFTNFLLIHNTLYLYQVLPLAFLISESARVGINHIHSAFHFLIYLHIDDICSRCFTVGIYSFVITFGLKSYRMRFAISYYGMECSYQIGCGQLY